MSAEAWIALGALIGTVVLTACGATAWISVRLTSVEHRLERLEDCINGSSRPPRAATGPPSGSF